MVVVSGVLLWGGPEVTTVTEEENQKKFASLVNGNGGFIEKRKFGVCLYDSLWSLIQRKGAAIQRTVH